MAKLDAFQLPGYALEMYPGDHSPPHFHLISDSCNLRIKFNISIIRRELAWDSKYPDNLKVCPLSGPEEKLLLELIRKNCKALNKQWKTLHPGR